MPAHNSESVSLPEIGKFTSSLVMLLTLVVETTLFCLWQDQPFNSRIYTLQAVQLWVLLAWTVYAYRRGNRGLDLLLLPLTALCGPFGSGICFLANLVSRDRKNGSTSADEWIQTFFAAENESEAKNLHDRLTIGGSPALASNVEPFQDILANGSLVEKQMAIAKIARYFRPCFAPLLKQAICDSNAAVRVQAATAFARIERDYTNRCIKLENKLSSVTAIDKEWLKLADLYDEYAHAGLSDEESRMALRNKAIRIYELYLQHQEDPEVRVHLARLYLRHDLPEAAAQLLDYSINQNCLSEEMNAWYMEALFRLKRYNKLRQITERFAGQKTSTIEGRSLPREVRGAVEYWNSSNTQRLASEETAHVV